MPRPPMPLFAALAVAALLVAGGAAAYNADDLFLVGKRNLILAAAESYSAGGKAPLSVGVEALDGAPVPGAPVVVRVEGEIAFRGTTASDGFARPEVPLPARPGPVEIVVEAAGERASRTVNLRDSRLVLLSTDKPLYQPGQTLHLRALVFDGEPLRAASLPVEFRVRDPEGNLVLKRTVAAQSHGVATAEYPLSDQLPLGTYRIEVSAGEKHAEQVVRVDRYALPIFDLSVDGLRSYYLPGESVDGTVLARYSFGKPVGGNAVVTMRTFYGVWREERAEGALDRDGAFRFSFRAPASAAGFPSEGGRALVEVRYEVTDEAGHAENESRVVPLASSPLEVRAIADRNFEGANSTWAFVVTRPDGTPVADASVEAGLSAGNVVRGVTDRRGVATLTFPYKGEESIHVRVRAGADEITSAFPAAASSGIKVVPSSARASVGDEVHFTIHYSGSSRTDAAYYEVESRGRAVDVGRVALADGRGVVRVPVTPDLAPLVTFRAYKLESDLTTVGDSAVVGVDAPADLRVEVMPSATRVAPGEALEVGVRLSTPEGTPVPGGALGISAVDRSVAEAASRYLTALQGASREVEKDLATPQYQIHAYVYANATTVPVLSGPLVARGDLGTGDAGVVLEEKGAAYAVQAVVVKNRAVLGYWVTVLLGLGGLILVGLAHYGGRLFHARKAFAVSASFLMAGLGGATWAVLHEPRVSQSGGGGHLADVDWAVAEREQEQVGAQLWANDVAAPAPPPVAATPFAARATEPGRADGMRWGASNASAFLLSEKADPYRMSDLDATYDRRGALLALEEARRFFPETWAWEPLVVPDAQGRATLRLVAPDRITTWDVQAFGHSPDARFGLGLANVTVFKPFFVEPDLPAWAVRNDEFPLRATIYNYESREKTVEVHLLAEDWFEALSPLEARVSVAAQGVASVDFLVKPVRVGTWNVSLAAKDGEKWDSLVKPLRIDPDGKARREHANGQLRDSASARHVVSLTPDRIPGSENAWIKIQGGREAIVVDGAEEFIRFVSGCGEQSLSVLDVNVLAYANLKRARGDALPAEKELKFETIITQGLAHELQYVVRDPTHAGRGIVWFPGETEAHPWLTAWGLLTFDNARRAGFTVDDRVIVDLQDWLRSDQRDDGRWTMTQGEFNNPQLAAKDVAATAYIARALLRSGISDSDPSVARALEYVRSRASDHAGDAYATALALAALAESGERSGLTTTLVERLAGLMRPANATAYWETEATPISRKAGDRFSGGSGPFTIETTAYAVLALDKLGKRSDLVEAGLAHLLENRQGGAFYGTQDTVVALTAINEAGTDAPVDSTVTVRVDGQTLWEGRLDASNRDVTVLVDLRPRLADGAEVVVESRGTGTARYSMLVEEYLPWAAVPLDAPPELELRVEYDASEVPVGGALAATLRVTYRGAADAARMVLVRVVAPVGFEFRPDDFAAMRARGEVSHFEVLGREANLYLGELPRGKEAALTYHLDAKMPVKATLQGVRAFDMYDPLVAADAPPVEVTSR